MHPIWEKDYKIEKEGFFYSLNTLFHELSLKNYVWNHKMHNMALTYRQENFTYNNTCTKLWKIFCIIDENFGHIHNGGDVAQW